MLARVTAKSKASIELNKTEWTITKAVWEQEPCTAPGIVHFFMRISHILTGAAFMAAFVISCSKAPNTPPKAATPDIGVVDFTDHAPKYYSLGEDKSCTISGVTDSKGIMIEVLFQATNADKTVQRVGTGRIYTAPGHPCVVSSGGVSVRFMPKF